MTSHRQIKANRRNALKSTGPKTDAGNEQSRCDAVHDDKRLRCAHSWMIVAAATL
jgi:hypothetical protein